MEVILRQSIDQLGQPGDIVKVSAGYARNFLLPRGLAYEATPGNRKRIALERSRLEAAENERRDAAQALATRLEQVSLTFSARVGEEEKLFGSVTAADSPSAQGYTPFEGQRLTGKVAATFLRGALVYDHGKVLGPAHGRYVARPSPAPDLP